jgi:hypothetical protein
MTEIKVDDKAKKIKEPIPFDGDFEKYLFAEFYCAAVSIYLEETRKKDLYEEAKKGIDEQIKHFNDLVFSGKRITKSNLEAEKGALPHFLKIFSLAIGEARGEAGKTKPGSTQLEDALDHMVRYFHTIYSLNGDYRINDMQRAAFISFFDELSEIAYLKTTEYLGSTTGNASLVSRAFADDARNEQKNSNYGKSPEPPKYAWKKPESEVENKSNVKKEEHSPKKGKGFWAKLIER